MKAQINLTTILVSTTCVLLATLSGANYHASAQATKGGSSFSSFSSNFGGSNQVPQISGTGGQSLSSSFVQMFNQLTPIQQQQFVRQMSSSNRRVFQQLVQPQTSFNTIEESSSSSTGANTGSISGSSSLGATKGGSLSFKQQQQQQQSPQILSPAQQNFFKQSKQSFSSSSVSQPIIQPSSAISFSRQISSAIQQPQVISVPSSSGNEFQSSKTIVNSIQPQPQQQQQSSFFNRVQQVQQVAQPVVLPSSEQSFRRVQSFSSQPLQPVQTESGFTQQIVQQQIQPVQSSSSSSFNRQQFSSSGFQPVGGFNNQQVSSSSSSSSNLAGGGSGGDFSPAGGFSGALQQEKVDSLSNFAGSSEFTPSIPQTSNFQNNFIQQQQQQIPQIVTIPSSSSFESSSSSSNFGTSNGALSGIGFDSTDAQQRNVAANVDDFYGLTAASINNKWYIMKPVENPSALGLGSAGGTKMRQVPLSRLIEASRSASSLSSSSPTSPKKTSSISSTSSSPKPKKRASGEEADKATVESTSSSAADSDEEESEQK